MMQVLTYLHNVCANLRIAFRLKKAIFLSSVCVYRCGYNEIGYVHAFIKCKYKYCKWSIGNTRTCYIGDGWFPTHQLIVVYPTDTAQSKAINSEF